MVQHLSSRLFKMQRSIGSPFREAHFVAILQSSLSLTKFYRMIKWSDPAILSAGIPLMNFNQLQILLARARRRLNDYDAFCSYLNSKPRNEVVGYAAYERKFGFDSHISNFFYHLFVKMRAQDTTVNDDYLRHAFGFDFKEMGDLKFNFQLIK